MVVFEHIILDEVSEVEWTSLISDEILLCFKIIIGEINAAFSVVFLVLLCALKYSDSAFDDLCLRIINFLLVTFVTIFIWDWIKLSIEFNLEGRIRNFEVNFLRVKMMDQMGHKFARICCGKELGCLIRMHVVVFDFKFIKLCDIKVCAILTCLSSSSCSWVLTLSPSLFSLVMSILVNNLLSAIKILFDYIVRGDRTREPCMI